MVKSLYEHLNKLSDPPKKRFVDNFTGRELDDKIWATTGNMAVTPNDEIDGGMHCDGVSGWSYLHQGNISHFSNPCSVIWGIRITRSNQTNQWGAGMIGEIPYAGSGMYATATYGSGASAYVQMVTRNSTGQANGVMTSMPFKGTYNWHKYQCDALSTHCQTLIDDMLEVTSTSKIPDSDMMPFLYCYNSITELDCNYCEAWNV